MHDEDGVERLLRKGARATDRLIEVATDRLETWPVRVFWGYHVVLMVILVLNGKLWDLDRELIGLAVAPILLIWGVVFGFFFFVHVPAHASHSLYSYLRSKDIPSSHALFLMTFTFIGAISTFLFFIRSP